MCDVCNSMAKQWWVTDGHIYTLPSERQLITVKRKSLSKKSINQIQMGSVSNIYQDISMLFEGP